MGFCIDEGWLEANPVLPRLGRLKERRDPIVLPDPAHIEILIRRAPGRLSDLIHAAWKTGCRMNELVSAKPAHFADNLRQLTVVGKRNKMRTIDLSDEAYEIIRRAAADGAPWIPSPTLRSQSYAGLGAGRPKNCCYWASVRTATRSSAPVPMVCAATA
jgi:site-specific recombinase XerD